MNKLGVITVGRSDFGLLYPLITRLKKIKRFQTLIFATGGHFSNFSGNTIKEAKKLNIKIDYKIKCSRADDSKHSITLSFSEALKKFSIKFKESSINSVILLGDRYEMFAAGIAASNLGLKIFHIGGGCTTLGAIDNKYRDAISILSDFHFVDLPEYKKKLINMGIISKNVFRVGSLGAINVLNVRKKNLNMIGKEIKIKLNNRIVLFTYHPTTLYTKDDKNFVKTALNFFKNTDIQIIISNPNEDHSRIKISKTYQKYKKCPNFLFIKNLGYENYANLLKHSKIMIGNSSSGIIEAASYNLPVLNLGIRQKGRITSNNVINIEKFNYNKMIKTLDKMINTNFTKTKIKNIYLNKKSYDLIFYQIKKIVTEAYYLD